MERTTIEGIDLNDPERFVRTRAPRDVPKLRAEDPVYWQPDESQGRRLLERGEARRPHRGEPRHRHLLVGDRRHDDHVGPVPGRRRPRRDDRHARRAHARHGPAEAHALPAAREQGLHAAHDRPHRAGAAPPRQRDRRQRDRDRLGRLRRRHRRRAAAPGDRRDHGRAAGGPPQAVRVVEPHGRRRRPRVHGQRHRRRVRRALRLRQRARRRAAHRSARRHRHQAAQRRDRGRAAERARVRHVHDAARGRGERDHPQRDRARHVRAPHQPRAVRAAEERSRGPHRRRGRGGAAVGVAGAALPSHRDGRHRDPRSADQGG